jgi:hypothetical protein
MKELRSKERNIKVLQYFCQKWLKQRQLRSCVTNDSEVKNEISKLLDTCLKLIYLEGAISADNVRCAFRPQTFYELLGVFSAAV